MRQVFESREGSWQRVTLTREFYDYREADTGARPIESGVVPVTSRDGMFRSVRIGVGANVGELSEHARHIGESLCG